MAEHSPLYWFPFDVGEWLKSPAVSAMLPEQEGAYLRLLLTSWGDGSAEPSLPTDQAKLAQLSRLGPRWRKLGHLIVEQFEERNGRLVNAKLAATWWQQQEAHATAVIRARAGGKASAAKRALKSTRGSTPSSTPSAQQADLELTTGHARGAQTLDGVVTPAPNGAGGNQSPASDDALAPVGAARAAATGDELAEFGDAWRAVMQGPGRAIPASRAPEDRRAGDRERRYFALLASEADAWMALHGDDAKALDREQRALLDLPATGDLLLADRRKLRDAVLEEIRVRLGWPTTEEWDESDALTSATAGTP